MFVATIRYQDKMQIGSGGAYPPHDFVLSLVSALTARPVWELRKLVDKNPRNGISKLISDVRQTDLLAGRGKLCVLVDRDRVAEHLGLPKNAPDAAITEALYQRSDAPEKLSVHFLSPNLEGLMRAIAECEPKMPAPASKDHNSRDIYFNKVAFSGSFTDPARDCVKAKQPSLGALVDLLAGLCREDA